MAPEEESEVASFVRAIPGLTAVAATPQRLGGLTNRVYAIGDYVLRIPGKGTEEYINRAHEMAMASLAAAAGVSPALIHADAKTGVMVTQRIAPATTLSPQGFRESKGAVARAAKALRQLHKSGQQFPARFELFAMIDDYLKIIASKNLALPPGYHAVVNEAQSIRRALAKEPATLAPCHCDPLCENFIDDGSRMWIVDWEYAGMNDPMWDLGDLSVEGAFTPEQDQELLHSYFAGPPTSAAHGRMVIYKAMCDLLWTLWGLIQHANNNPADDFAAYAANRFARCRRLMAEPDFARHVAAVAA